MVVLFCFFFVLLLTHSKKNKATKVFRNNLLFNALCMFYERLNLNVLDLFRVLLGFHPMAMEESRFLVIGLKQH